MPEKRSIKKQTQVFLNCLSTAPLGLFINYVSSIGEVLSDLYINLTGKINKKNNNMIFKGRPILRRPSLWTALFGAATTNLCKRPLA